ncbi:MAPEG family protein [Pseudanabaena sp. ABRG5-3]|uniref:MAPEG family protein n=1 Tax=Pseudanabaena sp. ABRG5-3 TaxID=685565 RepID=UPI000DC6F107|nr:MAPEG family protein [Pseudanabaena sp. ABRG5-3]BBC26380.1 hypothetical protein ABRG53_4123 [Pseudanabaena sp. ABRG5-3]
MTQESIFSPFFATILLTILVWIYMYIRRINFIVSRKLATKELTPIALAQLSPPAVSNPSDNLKNLFELPIIFYALVFYLFITKQVDSIYINAAWIFFGFRTLHSLVHCTFNLIMLRFYLYLISAIALWFMTMRAALMYFSS